MNALGPRYLQSLKNDFCRRLSKASFVLEIIGVIGVFGYATIAAFQWCAMLVANSNATEALRVTERAYVNVQDILVITPPAIGKRPEATVEYENSGLTAAKELFLEVSSGYLPGGVLSKELKEPLTKCWAIPSGQIMPPKVIRKRSTDLNKLPGGIPFVPPGNGLDAKTYDLIAHGYLTWYVTASVGYRDQFCGCHVSRETFAYNFLAKWFEPMFQGFAQYDSREKRHQGHC
jgi:hypothetical protein